MSEYSAHTRANLKCEGCQSDFGRDSISTESCYLFLCDSVASSNAQLKNVNVSEGSGSQLVLLLMHDSHHAAFSLTS